MPNFSKEVYVDTDIDIDVDEFLEECSSSEIREVKIWLVRNGDLSSEELYDEDEINCDFDFQVSKLIGSKRHLTKEEENTILRIANKF